MNTFTSRSPQSPARGFTLIEVLVAVLVLAIGLLGLAGLQVTGLRNNQSAYQRSQATQMAYDMADRMRANPAGITGGNYNNQSATADDCATNACTSAQMAGYDLAQWNAALSGQLTSGRGVVCLDGTPDDGTFDGATLTAACDGNGVNYAIKVWWLDDRSQDPPVFTRFVMSFQP